MRAATTTVLLKSGITRLEFMRHPSRLIMAAALLGVAACAEEPKFDKARADMTQRERDSTIAISGLPGSGVVKKAMSIADAEARRSANYDSAAGQ